MNLANGLSCHWTFIILITDQSSTLNVLGFFFFFFTAKEQFSKTKRLKHLKVIKKNVKLNYFILFYNSIIMILFFGM